MFFFFIWKETLSTTSLLNIGAYFALGKFGGIGNLSPADKIVMQFFGTNFPNENYIGQFQTQCAFATIIILDLTHAGNELQIEIYL